MNDLSLNLKETYVEYLIFKMKFMTVDEYSDENILEALNFHVLLDYVKTPIDKEANEEDSSLDEEDLKENLNFDCLDYKVDNKNTNLNSIPKSNTLKGELNHEDKLTLDKSTVNQINNLNKSSSSKEDFKISKEEFNSRIEKALKQISKCISSNKLNKNDLMKYFSTKINNNQSIPFSCLIVFIKEKLNIKMDLITQYCIVLMIKMDYPNGLNLDDLVFELNKFDLL